MSSVFSFLIYTDLPEMMVPILLRYTKLKKIPHFAYVFYNLKIKEIMKGSQKMWTDRTDVVDEGGGAKRPWAVTNILLSHYINNYPLSRHKYTPSRHKGGRKPPQRRMDQLDVPIVFT